MMRQFLTVVALAGCLTLSGCLVMGGSSIDESGVKVTESTLDQVEVGTTTRDWLLGALGEPTSRNVVDENTEVLRYAWSRTKSKGGAVFLIYAGGSETVEKTTAYFEVTDGIVTRFWTEG